MQVKLYTTNSDRHVINKELTEVGTYECQLKAPVDRANVEITIGSTNVTANYAYVADFGRYYHISPITQYNGITVYAGKSDPLMSFKHWVLSAPAVIARNPWKYDKYLPDNKLPIESRTVKGTLKFPVTNVFDGNSNCYILTTIGCGGSPLPEPGGDENKGGEGE